MPATPETAGRPAVGAHECVVESADAAKTRHKSDLAYRHRSVANKFFCLLDPSGRGHLRGRCADMFQEQPRQMPRANSQSCCQFLHRLPIEISFFNESQSALHRSRGTAPGRTAGRGFRPAAQTRPKPRSFGSGRRRQEEYVSRKRMRDRAYGTAIDFRRSYARVKEAVIGRISSYPSGIANVPVAPDFGFHITIHSDFQQL